jgi:hypothetical protein
MRFVSVELYLPLALCGRSQDKILRNMESIDWHLCPELTWDIMDREGEQKCIFFLVESRRFPKGVSLELHRSTDLAPRI